MAASGCHENSALVYKISETGPRLLKQICEQRGWIQYVEGKQPLYWNLSWKGFNNIIEGGRFRQIEHQELRPYQRLNHFPNTGNIGPDTFIAILTKKDSLFRLLRTMKGIYGSAFNFFPTTLTLPNEFLKFGRLLHEEADMNKQVIYII
jgi:tubulin polyglutamylase TTLL2